MEVKIQGDPLYRVFPLGSSEASDSMSTLPELYVITSFIQTGENSYQCFAVEGESLKSTESRC